MLTTKTADPTAEATADVAQPRVAICIATYRRNPLLQVLLDALREIETPVGWEIEVRVVDNDADGMARPLVEAFAALPGAPTVHYEIEPERSISHARNRGLEMGPANRVAFIDDDEAPTRTWLVRLMEKMDQTEAAAVFGAVQADYPADSPDWLTRGGLLDKSIPDQPLGWSSTRTSNTLVDGQWIYLRNFRFDNRFGRSGAEDTDMFRRMARQGALLHGAPASIVSEDVQPNQLRVGWFLKRHWRGGINYERLVRGDPAYPPAVFRFGKRVLLGSLGLLIGLPALLIGRPDRVIRSLTILARAGGGIRGWLQPASLENTAGYESEGCSETQARTEEES